MLYENIQREFKGCGYIVFLGDRISWWGTLFFWVTEYQDEIFLTANFVDFVQNSFDIHVHVKLDFNWTSATIIKRHKSKKWKCHVFVILTVAIKLIRFFEFMIKRHY